MSEETLNPCSKPIRTNPMKGGARRRTISSDLQPPQQSMNDSEDEYDEEEGEDYEEDDQTADGDVHGGADGGENSGDEEERPKLAEGFYEIEAVRRRRIRKVY